MRIDIPIFITLHVKWCCKDKVFCLLLDTNYVVVVVKVFVAVEKVKCYNTAKKKISYVYTCNLFSIYGPNDKTFNNDHTVVSKILTALKKYKFKGDKHIHQIFRIFVEEIKYIFSYSMQVKKTQN